jgi:hypothetical protein
VSGIPPWSAEVQRTSDGHWLPVVVLTDEPLDGREDAEELADFVVGHLDRRLRDVAAQVDAAASDPAGPTGTARPAGPAAPPFTAPAATRAADSSSRRPSA